MSDGVEPGGDGVYSVLDVNIDPFVGSTVVLVVRTHEMYRL